jgi:hypothetical protein
LILGKGNCHVRSGTLGVRPLKVKKNSWANQTMSGWFGSFIQGTEVYLSIPNNLLHLAAIPNIRSM